MTPPPFRGLARSAARAARRAASAACGAVSMIASSASASRVGLEDQLELRGLAACVVTLVDRLIHRSEIVQLDGESYRLREAKEHR